jgi:hypothetical protein
MYGMRSRRFKKCALEETWELKSTTTYEVMLLEMGARPIKMLR